MITILSGLSDKLRRFPWVETVYLSRWRPRWVERLVKLLSSFGGNVVNHGSILTCVWLYYFFLGGVTPRMKTLTYIDYLVLFRGLVWQLVIVFLEVVRPLDHQNDISIISLTIQHWDPLPPSQPFRESMKPGSTFSHPSAGGFGSLVPEDIGETKSAGYIGNVALDVGKSSMNIWTYWEIDDAFPILSFDGHKMRFWWSYVQADSWTIRCRYCHLAGASEELARPARCATEPGGTWARDGLAWWEMFSWMILVKHGGKLWKKVGQT